MTLGLFIAFGGLALIYWAVLRLGLVTKTTAGSSASAKP